LTAAFFRSVIKDIRMERSKVRPSDNIRTLFVSSTLVEYLLILRGKAQTRLEASAKKERSSRAERSSQQKAEERKEIKAKVDAEVPLGWAAEMVDIDALKWVTARMRIAFDDSPPAWTELQASIDCFTQIVSSRGGPVGSLQLLILEAMSSSTNQEDVDAGNLLQNQLYYNSEILDASIVVVSHFKRQSNR
jgi:replication fork protection complex subunit Tof1/Swi1